MVIELSLVIICGDSALMPDVRLICMSLCQAIRISLVQILWRDSINEDRNARLVHLSDKVDSVIAISTITLFRYKSHTVTLHLTG